MSIKLKVILLFILLPILISAQKIEDLSLFETEFDNKTNNYNSILSFYKTKDFFFKHKWDSVLVNSSNLLEKVKIDKELKDYCRFLRAYSFFKKKLHNEAKKEFSNLSETFIFNQKVQLILGSIALEQRQFNDAISFFKNALSSSESNSLYFKKSSVIHNLGLCYLHTKQYNKAERYLTQSVEMQEQQKDTLELIGSYGDLANLYYEQYKDDLAIPYFVKAYHLAQKIKDYEIKSNTTLNMAVVEENRKNLPKAMTYRKEYEKWKDSLNDQNKIWEVAQLEKEFAVKEKQKEVSLLQAENKLKQAERNGFLYSAIILLLLLLTSVYFYRDKVKKNRIIASQKENLDKLNATKDKLFSIVSHDLRSSVNALKTSNTTLQENLENKNIDNLHQLIQNNGAIVNGAYGLLDNLLHWSLLQTKQGYFEISQQRLFFIVEQVAFNYKHVFLGKNITFKNSVSKKDIAFTDQESLKIIIRNLLDNAIKFSEPESTIAIYTKQGNDAFCQLIVEDSGLGMTNETRLQLLEDSNLLNKKEHEDIIGTGLGLQLCKSLIKKNHGKFTIESELNKGTKMIVSLPKTIQHG